MTGQPSLADATRHDSFPAYTEAAAGTAAPSPAASLYAWYVLLILMLVNAFNAIDRALVGIVVEPIRAEFGFSDTQIGVLSGIGFALLYAMLGFPIARLADRYSRRTILAVGLAFWSLLTALTGRATGFASFLLARIGVGIGEASCYPTAYPLIGDYFPKARRPIAMAIFQMGMFVGIVGGNIIAARIAAVEGWRATFAIIGLPGLLLAALLFLTVREPPRGRYDIAPVRAAPVGGIAAALGLLLRDHRFLLLVIGTTCLTTAAATQASWGSAFMMRVHAVPLREVGIVSAPIGLCGMAGTILGGLFGSYFAKRREEDRAPLLVPLTITLLAVPGISLFILGDTVGLAVAGGMAGAFGIAVHTGPVLAVAIGLARPDVRGIASAMLVVGQLLIGFGLGPVAIGLISDALIASTGNQSLRWALAIDPALILLGWLAIFAAYRRIGAGAAATEG